MKSILKLITAAAMVLMAIAACSKQEQGAGTDAGNLSLNKTELTLMVEQTFVLQVNGLADGQTVSFKSSATTVASVNAKTGKITAKKQGEANVTATVGTTVLTCHVTVTPKENVVSSLTVSPSSLNLRDGETANLTAELSPSDATDMDAVRATLKWESSDETVATVSAAGVVTALTMPEGESKTATITATVTGKNGTPISATCTVNVSSNKVRTSSIQLNQSSLKLNPSETATLTCTFYPANHTDSPVVTWESSDPAVATVDGGVVTALDYGSAIITAKISDDIKATCSVLVREGPKSGTTIDMSATYFEYTWPENLASTEALTLECWVNIGQSSAEQSFLGTEGVLLIRAQSGQYQIMSGGAGASGTWDGQTEAKVTATAVVGEWHHVAGVYSAADHKIYLYVDGALAGEAEPKIEGAIPLNGREGYTDGANPNIFMVGNAYGRNRFLNGNIAYARVWNVVRTQEQIAADMAKKTPSGEGLIANWYFTDGEGDTVKDYSSTGANLTPKEGSISWVTGTLPSVQ